MSKVSYKIIKKEGRIFFFDGDQYVLFDSGFLNGSVAVNGKIGPWTVKTMPNSFLSSFINMKMEDGGEVTAVFNPMDGGYSCLLKGDTLTVSDEAIAHGESKYFFAFANVGEPIIEGSINGHNCRFLFDSGARMTMFGKRSWAAEKVRSYTEWMAMKNTYADLEVFKLKLTFDNGFEYEAEGALVEDALYQMAAESMHIQAMLGIDIFNAFDMYIDKYGAALLEKDR